MHVRRLLMGLEVKQIRSMASVRDLIAKLTDWGDAVIGGECFGGLEEGLGGFWGRFTTPEGRIGERVDFRSK